MRRLLPLTLFFSALCAQSAVVTTAGDKDCFGLAGACADGSRFVTDLGGVFFTNYQSGGDPSFSDYWDTRTAADVISFSYVVPVLATAQLEIRIAGIADLGSPYEVFFNGTSVGFIPQNFGADNYQEVLTYVFPVPVVLLNGADIVTFDTSSTGDGYIIDYAEIQGDNVPEPTTFAMLGLAAAGLAARRLLSR